MTVDNNAVAREKELARVYEVKAERRAQAIKNMASRYVTADSNTYYRNYLYSCFECKFIEAFSRQTYQKPSDFFLKEMPWIFGPVVYNRYRDAFLHMVDQVLDFPYSDTYYRRSFRSDNYLHYTKRIGKILLDFDNTRCIDADVQDILTGNLPEEVRCFVKHSIGWSSPFIPTMLAYALDREDPKLEAVVTDIVNGDNGFTRISWALVEAIVMTHNQRMHQLLCKLLLAAKLQEGLRQVICERADWGTKDAFLAILTTILEHDLIRYSSVKRAVGTWIGIMTEETRDLDRISTKSVELILKCLKNTDFREACIASEDSMAIHIGLWSLSFDNLRLGLRRIDRIIAEGTHHQLLTAGYFVANLDQKLVQHAAAREVLKERREHYDILAVYLPSFMPLPNYTANALTLASEHKGHAPYFDSADEAREFIDWLLTIYGSMKRKSIDFTPCIFPWHSASLKKSDFVEKAMVIAAMIGDQERIDRLCPCIPDCEALGRNLYLKLLTNGKKTSAVRKAIIDGFQDKSFDTRQTAFLCAKGMTLTQEEYRRVEEMLRLKYDDLRRNAMELLMNQADEELEASVKRLLESSKIPMRTAGLDLTTQLSKLPEKKHLSAACLEAVKAIARPTTQEQVLIDALIPKKTDEVSREPLFTQSDRYIPAAEIGEYELACIRTFMEIFPDSKLEDQVLAGNIVTHDSTKQPTVPCSAAKKARQNLNTLSDWIIAHEKETCTNFFGRDLPVGCPILHFSVWCKDHTQTVPRMELWQQWMEDNRISIQDLFGMMILSSAQPDKHPYLIRCGKYVCDIFGNGFEKPAAYRYAEHAERIVFELIRKTVLPEQFQKISLALGLWIARCLPEDMFISGSDQSVPLPVQTGKGEIIIHSADAQIHINSGVSRNLPGPAAHFIAHPQFNAFIYGLDHTPGKELPYRIPVLLNVYERTFAATVTWLKSQGQEVNQRVTLLLNQLYQRTYRLQSSVTPEVSIYLYARHYGLISDRTLYLHLMEQGNLKKALELITGVCAISPEEEEEKNGKNTRQRIGYGMRLGFEEFLGKDRLSEQDQKQLIALCRRAAENILPVVLDSELSRGDTPAEYSAHIMGILSITGAETFVRILRALGKDPLDRSVYYWSSSQSKRGNLSYLLARCFPAPGDDARKLADLLKDTDISEKRLVEAALYSPAWIDIIGQYLNLPGFQSACYYFMAHMNERFDDQKNAIIARYTPLSEDELNLGAFDVDWFRSAYDQLGEKKFDLIYDAAKYISDGAKHTRARKYADAALGRITPEDTEAAVKDKRNKDLLMSYAIIPLKGEDDLIHRYLYLQQFLKESRQFGSQRSGSEKKAVETALRNLATNAGFSDPMRLTLRMETKLVENSAELFSEKQAGEWVFKLSVDDRGIPEILCTKDGKLLKSIPAKSKKDPYVIRLQEMKKQLTDQYRRTRRMFEQAMEDSAEFTLEEMSQLWENPVVSPIVSKLVFKSGDHLGFFDGKQLRSLSGESLVSDAQAKLAVAHPLHLFRSGNWPSFQKYLFDNRIVQPFRQVFRELYVKMPEELGCFNSLRYAGNQIQPKKAAACLKERRWVADIEAGLQKIYYRENIVATIYALADWFTPAEIEAPTLEYVAFYHRKSGQALKIEDIPDVIFSEVMRDVDMAVSVAHAGAVDPETSHSTVEMRGAILSFTLPLLRLDNVEVSGSHAFIDGRLANYSVHLGSGVVHQLGGTMLNVLPVHSQHRGRFFLPFLDEDPKTAEIISKVILFAEDHKLKDPTILSQITG